MVTNVTVKNNTVKVDIPLKITSGSVNVHQLAFEFTPDWEGLTKCVFFRTDASHTAFQVIDENNTCFLPWEVCLQYGTNVYIEVMGKSVTGDLIFPTNWTQLGVVIEGLSTNAAFPASIAGTMSHAVLNDRELEEQHPIGAITELEEVLDTIPVAMTNAEIETLTK